MSRLGDMLKRQRTDSGLALKKAARMCGVSEGYLQDVEEGRRIIADDIAARMLRKMGLSEPIGLEHEAAAAPARPTAPPRPAPAKDEGPKADAEPADAWLDALGGVLRRVPVYAAGGLSQEVRLLPVAGGQIEGAPADKVFYVTVSDDTLTGYRLCEGDLALCVPAARIESGALHAVVRDGKTLLRRLTRIDGNRLHVESQRLGALPQTETLPLDAVKVLGRAVRCEFSLR